MVEVRRGGEHSDPELAVEVQRGTGDLELAIEVRRRKEEEGGLADIKSNNPHLTGGGKEHVVV